MRDRGTAGDHRWVTYLVKRYGYESDPHQEGAVDRDAMYTASIAVP